MKQTRTGTADDVRDQMQQVGLSQKFVVLGQKEVVVEHDETRFRDHYPGLDETVAGAEYLGLGFAVGSMVVEVHLFDLNLK